MLKETEKSFFSENIRYVILCPSDRRSVQYTVGVLSSCIAPGSPFFFFISDENVERNIEKCYL